MLDCACGVGYGSKMLAESGSNRLVTGVDVSPAAITHAKRCFSHERVYYIIADMRALAIGIKFDTIVSLESLEHVDDPSAVLRRFSAHMHNESNLVASLPLFPTVHVNRYHKFEVSCLKDAEAFFSRYGFAVHEIVIQPVAKKSSRTFGLFDLRRK